MRRKDRQVTDWQEICAILDACQVLHLGLQGADGPYVVPLSFGWEEQAGRIVLYFHGASAGEKGRAAGGAAAGLHRMRPLFPVHSGKRGRHGGL